MSYIGTEPLRDLICNTENNCAIFFGVTFILGALAGILIYYYIWLPYYNKTIKEIENENRGVKG